LRGLIGLMGGVWACMRGRRWMMVGGVRGLESRGRYRGYRLVLELARREWEDLQAIVPMAVRTTFTHSSNTPAKSRYMLPRTSPTLINKDVICS
jgi:hypothetical protein